MAESARAAFISVLSWLVAPAHTRKRARVRRVRAWADSTKRHARPLLAEYPDEAVRLVTLTRERGQHIVLYCGPHKLETTQLGTVALLRLLLANKRELRRVDRLVEPWRAVTDGGAVGEASVPVRTASDGVVQESRAAYGDFADEALMRGTPVELSLAGEGCTLNSEGGSYALAVLASPAATLADVCTAVFANEWSAEGTLDPATEDFEATLRRSTSSG